MSLKMKPVRMKPYKETKWIDTFEKIGKVFGSIVGLMIYYGIVLGMIIFVGFYNLIMGIAENMVNKDKKRKKNEKGKTSS